MTLHDAFLAAGVSLIVLGIFLRGFARVHRRTLAMRKQHELDVRQPGESPPPPSHFDRRFPTYANAVLLLGVGLVVAAILH